MTSLPIAPDESSGEPRCQRECPHRSKTYPTSTVFGPCAITQRPPLQHGALCLPRVRELVAISRRRCDGCRHVADFWTCPDRAGVMGTEESCSRWEARP